MEKINEMGDFNLSWGRPLKSILSIFDREQLILSSIILDHQIYLILIKNLRIKKSFVNFKTYELLKIGGIVDQNKRKGYYSKFKRYQLKKNW